MEGKATSLLRVDVAVDHELGVVVAELDDDDRRRNSAAMFFSFQSPLLAEEGILHYLCFSSRLRARSSFFPLVEWWLLLEEGVGGAYFTCYPLLRWADFVAKLQAAPFPSLLSAQAHPQAKVARHVKGLEFEFHFCMYSGCRWRDKGLCA